jgi:integral membrane protein
MNNLKILSILAILEGISYLVLLGICMPLKYIYDIPEPTRPVGMIHGILFVAFLIWVVIVGNEKNWNLKVYSYAFVASLLPIGTFMFDKKYVKR